MLSEKTYNHEEIVQALACKDEKAEQLLFQKARDTRDSLLGNSVYLRGLIEFSNRCSKNCYYCGIRAQNSCVKRYFMDHDEIVDIAKRVWDSGIYSLVLQSGDNFSKEFIDRVDLILKNIAKATNGQMRVTLSCGEQTKETYRKWFESGAQRYLLRIESSNSELYKKIHPDDEGHRYENRIECLRFLREVGYQVGSGFMVGVPMQTLDDIANDILFLKDIDVDMVGLGPYVEHPDAPLYSHHNSVMPEKERVKLCLKTIALLRLVLKDVNIASATALEALMKGGKMRGIMVGANVVMPNFTPTHYQEEYNLYQNKPEPIPDYKQMLKTLNDDIAKAHGVASYQNHGDARHFVSRS